MVSFHYLLTPPIAQLVEQRPFKPVVPGSSPGGRTQQYNHSHQSRGIVCMRNMNEKIIEAGKKGEEIAKRYNLETRIPFPFEEIIEKNSDLDIFLADLSNINGEERISGLILFKKEEGGFEILIEKSKPKNRQYFTIAHELGHYFLHKKQLEKEVLVIEGEPTLYRIDNGLTNIEEAQANFFAGSLLMPEERVKKVWKKIKDVEECANFFDVSVSAMGVRLEVLELI